MSSSDDAATNGDLRALRAEFANLQIGGASSPNNDDPQRRVFIDIPRWDAIRLPGNGLASPKSLFQAFRSNDPGVSPLPRILQNQFPIWAPSPPRLLRGRPDRQAWEAESQSPIDWVSTIPYSDSATPSNARFPPTPPVTPAVHYMSSSGQFQSNPSSPTRSASESPLRVNFNIPLKLRPCPNVAFGSTEGTVRALSPSGASPPQRRMRFNERSPMRLEDTSPARLLRTPAPQNSPARSASAIFSSPPSLQTSMWSGGAICSLTRNVDSSSLRPDTFTPQRPVGIGTPSPEQSHLHTPQAPRAMRQAFVPMRDPFPKSRLFPATTIGVVDLSSGINRAGSNGVPFGIEPSVSEVPLESTPSPELMYHRAPEGNLCRNSDLTFSDIISPPRRNAAYMPTISPLGINPTNIPSILPRQNATLAPDAMHDEPHSLGDGFLGTQINE